MTAGILEWARNYPGWHFVADDPVTQAALRELLSYREIHALGKLRNDGSLRIMAFMARTQDRRPPNRRPPDRQSLAQIISGL